VVGPPVPSQVFVDFEAADYGEAFGFLGQQVGEDRGDVLSKERGAPRVIDEIRQTDFVQVSPNYFFCEFLLGELVRSLRMIGVHSDRGYEQTCHAHHNL